MNTTTAYTPLESLLLFQSLAVSGTEPDVFIQTSNVLKRNALIRDGESYDPGRLSSDALRELYLSLLRDEVAYEAQQGDGRGDGSPSRKRKLSTPPISNIKDANQYSEKVPLVVDRLYTRYRDVMIKSIREDERKYALLQREIGEIERGEWDERLQKDDRTGYIRAPSVVTAPTANESAEKKTSSESPPTVAQALPDKQILEAGQLPIPQEQVDPQNRRSPPRVPSPHNISKPEGVVVNEVIHSRVSTDPPTSTQPVSNGVQVMRPLGHQRTPSHERVSGPIPLQPLQSRPPEYWKWEHYPAPAQAPQAPPLYPTNPSYPAFTPSQYPAFPPGPPRGSFSGTPAHGMPLSQSHVSPSPLTNPPLVPPQPNPGQSAGSPGTRHLDQLAEVAELQYRAPTASPLVGVIPGTQYNPQYPGYANQYRGIDVRPTSGNGVPQQWNPRFLPQFASTPTYNYAAQPLPNQGPFPPRTDIIQPGQQEYKSPYVPNQNARLIMPTSSSTPRPLHLRDSGGLPHTPASISIPRHSTGKATKWTPNPTPGTPKAPQSPRQPEYEPLSPVLQSKIPTKSPRTSGKGKRGGSNPENRTRLRGKAARRGTQAGSPVSSALTGSYRSESVMSHADELSLANENMGQNFKRESATPRTVDDIGDTTADESITLRRGVKGQVRPRKRKIEESHLREPSAPPTHVRWTRNFPKISASALERIGAHRHASIFSQPIKEQNAPGYKNIIRRPQDLKSIRTAINSGLKHGAAIASGMGDQGQASVSLPISEDLVPPKGIVNNAQVEKELMRMFANAIMFNHGPNRGFGKAFEVAASIEESGGGDKYELDENSVVNDTRAMFADVEKIVGEMRGAEWRQEKEARGQVEDDDLDELAGGSDMASGSLAKRRRRV